MNGYINLFNLLYCMPFIFATKIGEIIKNMTQSEDSGNRDKKEI